MDVPRHRYAGSDAFAAPGGYILVTRGKFMSSCPWTASSPRAGDEISDCAERDDNNVIRKQELATLGKETVSGKIDTGGSASETFARNYVETHGATIMLTALDRDAEFRADEASEVYLARSGMNPIALYSVLQKMVALGEKSLAWRCCTRPIRRSMRASIASTSAATPTSRPTPLRQVGSAAP